jgi:hypothetical protein
VINRIDGFVFFVINAYISIYKTETLYFSIVLKEHLAVFLGLPQAAAVSFAIVVFLRQTDGPFEFKILGLEAKGSSGQVIMWVFTFLAMTGAMRAVW